MRRSLLFRESAGNLTASPLVNFSLWISANTGGKKGEGKKRVITSCWQNGRGREGVTGQRVKGA